MALIRFQQTPTVTVPGTAYIPYDVIGGLLTFTGLRGGKIKAVTIADRASQTTVQYLLVLFESAPTTIADNSPYDIADADLAKIVFGWKMPQPETAEITGPFGGAQAFADNGYMFSYGLDYPVWSAGGAIYGFLILISGNVPTFATTTDLTISLLVELG